MDRLTRFFRDICGTRYYRAVNNQRQKSGNKQDFINALGLYEDTRLSPIEVAELAKAKSYDQLIILPCRVGEKAYLLLEPTVCKTPEIIETVCLKYFQCVSGDGISEQWSFYFKCAEIGNSLEFRREEFGKTVFTSKSVAQSALYRLESDKK